MKRRSHILLGVLGLFCAAGCFLAAVLLDSRITESQVGLLCGMGGMLAGVSAVAIILEIADHRRTPEQRKELERGETDERNVAIREKAAMNSWYWSTYLLWGLFFVTLILGQGVYIALSSIVITLHCVFYLVNIRRWAQKM